MLKMKEKIELNQGDLLESLVEKIGFLMDEYKNLYDAFSYKGRGKTKTDPIKITESYERFLSEEGDIKRLLVLYDMFDVEYKPEPKKRTRRTTKKDTDNTDKQTS